MLNKRKLFIYWVLGNMIAIAVPPALLWSIFWAYGFSVGLGLIGLSMGIAQGIILKIILRRFYLWTVVTVIAWLVGWGVALKLVGVLPLSAQIEVVLMASVIGFILGVSQSFLLKVTALPELKWIIGTILGFMVGVFAYFLFSPIIAFSVKTGPIGGIGQGLVYGLSGGVYSIITGIALTQLPLKRIALRNQKITEN